MDSGWRDLLLTGLCQFVVVVIVQICIRLGWTG